MSVTGIKTKILTKDRNHSCEVTLSPFDNRRLISLCGRFDENLRQIEDRFQVEILNRGNAFQLAGKSEHSIKAACRVLQKLYDETEHKAHLSPKQVHLSIQQENANTQGEKVTTTAHQETLLSLATPEGEIKPRTPNQLNYIKNIQTHDINFGVGPAGTGKTFLAVACAASALVKQEVRRIILTRPIVEAGERLGFLPGDLSQKTDPYLRPLYDALYEMLGFEKVTKLLEQQIIEIAPLAYMRGRTLNDAYVILDEGQNTTIEQMKMFLTRMGFGTKVIITGDVTQIDLPKGKESGLKHAIRVLDGIDAIGVTYLQGKDVIRHPLIQAIVAAYTKHEAESEDSKHDH